MTGTHKEAFMGIPATGKRVATSTIVIFRLTTGQIVEAWSRADTLSLLQQLGAIATPGQPG